MTGAIFSADLSMTITNGNFMENSANSADGNGGAIYCSNAA